MIVGVERNLWRYESECEGAPGGIRLMRWPGMSVRNNTREKKILIWIGVFKSTRTKHYKHSYSYMLITNISQQYVCRYAIYIFM